MRVLLSTIGSRGDVQPLVAFAATLQALGHEVRVCAPPDFREWIESLGIRMTAVGPEVRKFAASRTNAGAQQFAPTPEQRRQMVAASVETQFETLMSAAATGCDVIVAASALQVAARSVAEKLQIPYIFTAYSPVVLPSAYHAPPPLPPMAGPAPAATTDPTELWAADSARFQATFGSAVNERRIALGLPEVHDLQRHMMTDEPWLAADPSLAPWPGADGGAVFQPGAWILEDERPLQAEIVHFLESGDPPIYFGFGSTRAPEGGLAAVLEAARTLRRRAIFSRGWFDEPLVENQPDCLSIGDVNLRELFPHVAAVVHHGGAGTTTLAALAGAPQVVCPVLYDQFYWAERVQALGIGVAHPPGGLTKDSLWRALGRVMEQDVISTAREIRGGVLLDGTAVAAEKLATYVRDAAQSAKVQ